MQVAKYLNVFSYLRSASSGSPSPLGGRGGGWGGERAKRAGITRVFGFCPIFARAPGRTGGEAWLSGKVQSTRLRQLRCTRHRPPRCAWDESFVVSPWSCVRSPSSSSRRSLRPRRLRCATRWGRALQRPSRSGPPRTVSSKRRSRATGKTSSWARPRRRNAINRSASSRPWNALCPCAGTLRVCAAPSCRRPARSTTLPLRDSSTRCSDHHAWSEHLDISNASRGRTAALLDDHFRVDGTLTRSCRCVGLTDEITTFWRSKS